MSVDVRPFPSSSVSFCQKNNEKDREDTDNSERSVENEIRIDLRINGPMDQFYKDTTAYIKNIVLT